MGRVNTAVLDEEAKSSLVKGFKAGMSHAFLMRYQLILLKSEGKM